MTSRGEVRAFVIFAAVVMALILVVVPIIFGYPLSEKIFSFLMFAIFILLIKDLITGKVWDAAHAE